MQQLSGPVATHHNLPRHLTPFVGRQQELAQIVQLLADPHCRLLALVGPGGIGKTRLAIAVATTQLDCFCDGVYFVNLQPISTPDFLASAVSDALALPLSSHEAVHTQLLHHLRDKSMLLLLDNFEHLLGGAELLTSLLQAAPRIKLLVTSREALNLQEEQLFWVQGLDFPSGQFLDGFSDDMESAGARPEQTWQAYSAVQLFIERARRVRPDFPSLEEQRAVLQICHLVEGMPLAIELAAVWAKTMRCNEIALEIARNLDLLATNLRNLPERHRSIKAVFEQSWRMLAPQEQLIFQRLSVFRGGFKRSAAEQVAGASWPLLSLLVDKSLLRWEPDGRYQLHELLRQYAEERLEQTPEAAHQVRERHCRFYAGFAARCYKTLLGPQQPQFPVEIGQELENIRQAWNWAVQVADGAAICQLADPLQQYYDLRGRCLEGVATLRMAVQRLEPFAREQPKALALAFVLNLLGLIQIRVGQLAQARIALERSRALYDRFAVMPPASFSADPLTGLGILANAEGNYLEALNLGEAARRRCETRADEENLSIAHYVLANAAFALGKYDQAYNHARRAQTLSLATGNRWFGAYVLRDLGNIVAAMGDYDQARQFYQESYNIKAEFADPEGTASALNNLARIAWLERNYIEAERLHQQSLAIYRQIDDLGGLATTLGGLGNTELALGRIDTARNYFQQALQIAFEMRYWPITLMILVGVSELFLKTRQEQRGIELCRLVHCHPASNQETKARARFLLDSANSKFVQETSAEVGQSASGNALTSVVESLLLELTLPLIDRPNAPTSPVEAASSLDHSLVEPLTGRELEVLQLLSDGLTNREIAQQLVIALGTVKSYTSSIYGKLGVRSRTQAVARARALNLLQR